MSEHLQLEVKLHAHPPVRPIEFESGPIAKCVLTGE